jgi:hypothetical protein
LPSKNYDDLALGIDRLYIKTSNSPITIYIQHPIPIPAPGEKNKVTLKPIKLTKKVWLYPAEVDLINISRFVTGAEEDEEAETCI